MNTALHENIKRVYDDATLAELAEGMAWYGNAHNILAAVGYKRGLSVRVTAGVCAAISPSTTWERNLAEVILLLEDHNAMVGAYGRRNRDKALRIIAGEDPLDVLGGSKVRSFYLNLVSPTEDLAVTIDRHMKCLTFDVTSDRDANSTVTKSEYVTVSNAIRELAYELRILPLQLQAVTWTVWRNRWGGVKNFG